MKIRSAGRSSIASKSAGSSRRANPPTGRVSVSIRACGIATPSPTPVEPSRSRSSTASWTSRGIEAERPAPSAPDSSARTCLRPCQRARATIALGRRMSRKAGHQRSPARRNTRIELMTLPGPRAGDAPTPLQPYLGVEESSLPPGQLRPRPAQNICKFSAVLAGINPADITVRAAVDHVQPAVGGVAEHHCRENRPVPAASPPWKRSSSESGCPILRQSPATSP